MLRAVSGKAQSGADAKSRAKAKSARGKGNAAGAGADGSVWVSDASAYPAHRLTAKRKQNRLVEYGRIARVPVKDANALSRFWGGGVESLSGARPTLNDAPIPAAVIPLGARSFGKASGNAVDDWAGAIFSSPMRFINLPNQAEAPPDAALAALREAREEAAEEGFPTPSDAAIQNAERLLFEMRRISPLRIDAYPGPDGEIALDVAPPPPMRGRSVILLCESDGSAFCSLNIDGANRNKRYSSADALPDDFLREILSDLASRRV